MRLKKGVVLNDDFLFNQCTGESFALNQVAREVLLLFQQGVSYDEVMRRLMDEYEVSEPVLRSDLHDFFLLLCNHDIIDNG